MKKLNKKGFLLTETLIVSTFIASTMIFIFVQFRRVNTTFDRAFSYNNVNSLYALNNMNDYIMNNGYDDIAKAIDTNVDNPYVGLINDDGTCSTVYLTNIDYCNKLVEVLQIEKLFVTNEDLTVNNFKDNLNKYGEFDSQMTKFIKFIKYDDITESPADSIRKRTIARFKDGTYATLKLYPRSEDSI